MVSISPISSYLPAPLQTPVTQAASTAGTGTARASDVTDPANDTTSYVTNADGTVSVTTSNAQGQVIEIYTIPAAAVTTAASGGASAVQPGAFLRLVA